MSESKERYLLYFVDNKIINALIIITITWTETEINPVKITYNERLSLDYFCANYTIKSQYSVLKEMQMPSKQYKFNEPANL